MVCLNSTVIGAKHHFERNLASESRSPQKIAGGEAEREREKTYLFVKSPHHVAALALLDSEASALGYTTHILLFFGGAIFSFPFFSRDTMLFFYHSVIFFSSAVFWPSFSLLPSRFLVAGRCSF